jgi:hypothetical protein
MAKLGPRAQRIAERDFRGALEQEMETRFLAPVRVRGIQNGRAAIGVFNRSPRAQPVTSKEK